MKSRFIAINLNEVNIIWLKKIALKYNLKSIKKFLSLILVLLNQKKNIKILNLGYNGHHTIKASLLKNINTFILEMLIYRRVTQFTIGFKIKIKMFWRYLP